VLVCEPQHVSSGVNKSAKKITFWPHGEGRSSWPEAKTWPNALIHLNSL